MSNQAERGDHSEKGNQPKKERSVRYWEYYVVRYTLGTIVGAVIVQTLCRLDPFLKDHLSKVVGVLGAGDASSVSAAHLTLLAASGLAYCYIASAPILVFHACRFLLKPTSRLWFVWLVVRSVVAALLAFGAAIGVVRAVGVPAGHCASMAFYSGFCLMWLFWQQIIAVSWTVYKNDKLYEFYENLEKRRSKATDDIMDSYRHLREHANSLFIVILELLLAFVLFGAGEVTRGVGEASGANAGLAIHLGLFILWILPSTVVWLIAVLFEYRFSESPSSD